MKDLRNERVRTIQAIVHGDVNDGHPIFDRFSNKAIRFVYRLVDATVE